MDRYKILEERLREESCKGDFEAVVDLITKGLNVNSTNPVNGWTALHWAAKRGHKDIVRLLLEHGADPTNMTEKGETPLAVATNPEVRLMLGSDSPNSGPGETQLPITPNYLKSQPIPGGAKMELTNGYCHRREGIEPYIPHQNEGELVLKVRVANGGDPDFIEVELSKSELTYYSLLRVCCEELGIAASQVSRIRKLPNTMLRKDKDVQRLCYMQELEIVLNSGKLQSNGYKSIQLYKNQTILY